MPCSRTQHGLTRVGYTHVFCAAPGQKTQSWGLAFKAQADWYTTLDSITLVSSWFVSDMVGYHDVKYCYSACQHDQPVYFSSSG